MDRLNRMLQAAQGMGMGSAAPGGVSALVTLHLATHPIIVFLSYQNAGTILRG